MNIQSMFESFLRSLPKSRQDMVNELELPDVTLTPYYWNEPDDSVSDSLPSTSIDCVLCDDASTDSSMPLSRAMTDSDIDYDLMHRYKRRSSSEPWNDMRAAMEAFPPSYLKSLSSYQLSCTSDDSLELQDSKPRPRHLNEELTEKMIRFFDEECKVFEEDDPGLTKLTEALDSIDSQILNKDI